MTYELYNDWIQASKSVPLPSSQSLSPGGLSLASLLLFCSIQDQDKRLQALLNACEKLPPANNHNFK